MPVALAVLPEHRQQTIVVGASVRKPSHVLKPYLDSLARQELPPNTKLHFVFVPDFTAEQADARELLARFVKERDGELLRGHPSAVADFSDAHPQTHQWSPSAMQRVGANKDKLIQHARALGADALWLCDADLVLDTTTLACLLAADKPITTAVYWTHWHRQGYETRQIHAAPQVWLRHPYELHGRGMDESEFRTRLLNRELFVVPGYGACTLIRKHALDAGVSFAYLPDVPPTGLMAGEDRHFCLRSERLHIQAFADGWPDIFHIYHVDDADRIAEHVERLGAPHPTRASLGDLVSLKAQPLEPVPHQQGWTMVAPQFARGRLGQLALMPELEEAVYTLDRGKDVTVPVHFPASYPVAYYRGKRRLLRLTLIDCKPFCVPPVVEQELFVGPHSGRWLSTTDYSAKQLEGMKEVANGALS